MKKIVSKFKFNIKSNSKSVKTSFYVYLCSFVSICMFTYVLIDMEARGQSTFFLVTGFLTGLKFMKPLLK